jgi:hypothetical protein
MKKNPGTVKVKKVDISRAFANGTLTIELEPHSLTAIEINQ